MPLQSTIAKGYGAHNISICVELTQLSHMVSHDFKSACCFFSISVLLSTKRNEWVRVELTYFQVSSSKFCSDLIPLSMKENNMALKSRVKTTHN